MMHCALSHFLSLVHNLVCFGYTQQPNCIGSHLEETSTVVLKQTKVQLVLITVQISFNATPNKLH